MSSWAQALCWLVAAYVAGVFALVTAGTSYCAVMRRRQVRDSLQEAAFGRAHAPWPRRLEGLLVETFWQAVAFVLQALYTARLLPAVRGTPGTPKVVLLHGFVENPGTMWWLARRLAATGYDPISLALPSNSAPIERNAQWLAERIDELRRSEPAAAFPVIAHSMGGVIARTMVLSRADHGVSALAAICSPFRGTCMAPLGASIGLGASVVDMQPGSDFMRRHLHDRACPIPLLSWIGLQENIVCPEWTCVVAGAEVVATEACGHVTLLYSRRAFAVLERWLRRGSVA